MGKCKSYFCQQEHEAKDNRIETLERTERTQSAILDQWQEERQQQHARIEQLEAALRQTIEPLERGKCVADGESFHETAAIIQASIDVVRKELAHD